MNELSLLEGLVSGFEGEVEAGRKVIAHQARALRMLAEMIVRHGCEKCPSEGCPVLKSKIPGCIEYLIDYALKKGERV